MLAACRDQEMYLDPLCGVLRQHAAIAERFIVGMGQDRHQLQCAFHLYLFLLRIASPVQWEREYRYPLPLLCLLAVEMTTLEVQPDIRFVADDPRVVPRWEKLGIARTYLGLRAIVHAHVQPPR